MFRLTRVVVFYTLTLCHLALTTTTSLHCKLHVVMRTEAEDSLNEMDEDCMDVGNGKKENVEGVLMDMGKISVQCSQLHIVIIKILLF